MNRWQGSTLSAVVEVMLTSHQGEESVRVDPTGIVGGGEVDGDMAPRPQQEVPAVLAEDVAEHDSHEQTEAMSSALSQTVGVPPQRRHLGELLRKPQGDLRRDAAQVQVVLPKEALDETFGSLGDDRAKSGMSIKANELSLPLLHTSGNKTPYGPQLSVDHMQGGIDHIRRENSGDVEVALGHEPLSLPGKQTKVKRGRVRSSSFQCELRVVEVIQRSSTPMAGLSEAEIDGRLSVRLSEAPHPTPVCFSDRFYLKQVRLGGRTGGELQGKVLLTDDEELIGTAGPGEGDGSSGLDVDDDLCLEAPGQARQGEDVAALHMHAADEEELRDGYDHALSP